MQNYWAAHHLQNYSGQNNPNTNPNAPNQCPQLPGTVLRIYIPAGAVINLTNFIEVSSPGGICLIVRLPLLGDTNLSFDNIMQAVTQAGGSVEVQQQ